VPLGNPKLQVAAVLCSALLLAGATSATTAAKTSSTPSSASSHSSSSKHSASKHSSKKHSTSKTTAHHGQRGIDSERTQAIQQALIREGYLSGSPTGTWDQQTKDALVKYQAANGWQTKITPDSRALIKLGLGPDHKGLLNPETANIPAPHELGLTSPAQPGGAVDQQ